MGKRMGHGFLTAAAVVLAVGCGSHNSSGADGGVGGTSAYNGHAGYGGTTGAAGNTGVGAAGNAGAAGGGAGGAGGIGGFQANCDATALAAAPTACGTQTCAAASQFATYTCRINCCASTNVCGTRTASMDPTMSTQCAPAAVPDTRCANIMLVRNGGMGGAGGAGGNAGGRTRMLTGCCTPNNECGGIVQRTNTCESRKTLAMQGSGVPAASACDAAQQDAGE